MQKRKKDKLNVKKNRQFIRKMGYSSIVSSKRLVDLSYFEDAPDCSFLIKIGIDAAINAVNENKALGIPITFLLEGWVVRRMPNGEIQRIIKIDNEFKNRRIAKGTILHVKKRL